tara:strand:- start:484 stop:774 length:291 start_codon:yes stop_codon:yes gene_type:complete
MKITIEELRVLVRETIFQEKSKRKKRSKKYFGSTFYDKHMLHGDSISGEGNRDKKGNWSKGERNKRKSKCDNPKGFTMKQFCKNQKTRSKKGERKN